MGIYNIIVGDIYNYNETGVRLSIGKKEKVIITIFKALIITAVKDISQESATVAEIIFGNSAVLPLFVTALVENGGLWQTIMDSIGQVLDSSGYVIKDRINL